MPPPPLSVVALIYAAFAAGISVAILLALRGQQGRPGAILGISLGAPLSVGVGVLGGVVVWSMLEEAAMSATIALVFGPVLGSFLGAWISAVTTREVASGIAKWRS